MEDVLLIILVFTLLSVAALFLNDLNNKRKFRKFIAKKYQIIETLKRKLDARALLTEEEVLSVAIQPALRPAVYHLLKSYEQSHLFPHLYNSYEKGAESYLVTWLEFPTELGRAPEEIELLSKILIEDGLMDYYVFKFRSTQPKWAYKLRWMVGVVGPYMLGSSPYDVPKRIFSRFNPVDTTSPEHEAMWVHENISKTDCHRFIIDVTIRTNLNAKFVTSNINFYPYA